MGFGRWFGSARSAVPKPDVREIASIEETPMPATPIEPVPEVQAPEPDDFPGMAGWVQDAIRSGDMTEAARRCDVVVARHPEESFGYASRCAILLTAGRLDEARDVLAAALEHLPDRVDLLVAGMQLGLARSDGAEARRFHDRLVALYPQHRFTLDTAPAFAAKIERLLHVDRQRAHRAAALEAQRHARWQEAEAAWRAMDNPEDADREILMGLARAVREGSDRQEAERLAQRVLARFPDDAEAHANAAIVAMGSEDWSEAVARWAAFSRVAPAITAFDGMVALSHARTGEHAEAEAIMARAFARDPLGVETCVSRARIAGVAEHWDEAVRRWDAVVSLRPGVAAFVTARGEAIWHRDLESAGAAEAVDGGGTTSPFSGEASPGADIAGFDGDVALPISRRMLAFESLGDNCEFGLVQRHFGADPIGLLRFAVMPPRTLLRLLDLDFEPLGDPRHIFLEEKGGEYIVRDDRGYYEMHSFVPVSQVGPERYLRQQQSRITLLKRKLMTQLREGGRIYVCKQTTRVIGDDTLAEISRLLQRHGDNLLLGIRPATEDMPRGHVEVVNDRVMIGHVGWMFGGLDPTIYETRIDYHAWEHIVAAAHAQLVRTREARPAAHAVMRA